MDRKTDNVVATIIAIVGAVVIAFAANVAYSYGQKAGAEAASSSLGKTITDLTDRRDQALGALGQAEADLKVCDADKDKLQGRLNSALSDNRKLREEIDRLKLRGSQPAPAPKREKVTVSGLDLEVKQEPVS